MYIGVLSSLSPNIIIYSLLFVVFFIIIQIALEKSLKDKGSASIIALCVSLLSVYGLSKTKFDIEGTFYNIGINESIIYNVLPILIIFGMVYLFWKVKLRWITTVLGLILIIGSRLVYEKTIVLIIGIVIFLFGVYLMIIETRRRNRSLRIRHT